MLEGESTVRRQYASASEAFTSDSLHQQLTRVTHLRQIRKGKQKKNMKCMIFLDENLGSQLFFTDSITNLKNKN